MAHKKFSAFWTIVLLFAIIWFGKEIGWINYHFDFPWIPAILIIIALSVMINKAMK